MFGGGASSDDRFNDMWKLNIKKVNKNETNYNDKEQFEYQGKWN